MNKSTSFMVVSFPLTTQLDGFDGLADLGAGNTIVFTTIPAGVRVYFAVDNNSSSKIEALQGMQIKTNHGGIYFTTVGTSASPMVLAHWASDDMAIEMPPISTFESLNGFGLTAFNQLVKAMNPYDITLDYGLAGSSTSLTTMINKTLTCDKLTLKFNAGMCGAGQNGELTIRIDGVAQASQQRANHAASGGEYSTILDEITIYNCKGKTLLIHGFNTLAYGYFCHVTEYTLKA